MSTGRNDPCPCGSGAKYKRCCLSAELESEQLVAGMERTVKLLGEEIWSAEPDWCLDRLAEFYEGGLEAFGPIGPSADELLRAQLWFLLDCPLPDGDTPLGRLERELTDRHVELLSRSELRAWRVLELAGDRRLTGLCPLGGGKARLELSRAPVGELERGCFIVARSVPLGPERWALIGTTTAVERTVAADFEGLLAALDAPLGQLWRVHGGVLARAAWAWPELRECTIEGEVVQPTIGEFDVRDRAAVAHTLDADDELIRGGEIDGWAERWRWRWSPPAAAAPCPSAGVRHELAPEESGPEPQLADLDLGLDGHELWLSAITPARFNLAERLLRQRLGPLLGETRTLLVEPRSATPRWRALAMQGSVERLGAALAAARRAA